VTVGDVPWSIYSACLLFNAIQQCLHTQLHSTHTLAGWWDGLLAGGDPGIGICRLIWAPKREQLGCSPGPARSPACSS